jgi:hypothetical protein
MIDIEMQLNIPVQYQMGNPLQQGRWPCQIGVNTFYKRIEFQVNSFDSYWEILIILKLEAPRSLYSSPGYNNNISQ